MAEPVSPVFPQQLFEHQEIVLGAGDTGAMPLPVYHDGQKFLSRWKLTPRELELVARSGEVILAVWGARHPPVDVFIDELRLEGEKLVWVGSDEDPLERIAKL